jgi:hypothetical protein
MTPRTRGRLILGAALAGAVLAVTGMRAQSAPQPSAGSAGLLEVTFLYMPPTTIDPTYHTAMWLEDLEGRLVKTLYVSQELSANEYKMGNVCPDWVKKSQWEKAVKSEVDAVTAPTPNVGSEAKVFDLGALGVRPGDYEFKFQMHVLEDHNVLFRAKVTVGGPNQTPALEMTQGPGKLMSTDQYIREVQVRYLAPSK